MKKYVYDLPTRVFHWLFASLFVFAFLASNLAEEESAWFSWHMLAGIVLFFVVLARIFWGLIGTRHARFSGFSLNPHDLIGYFKAILTGDLRKWTGHNPASSWAAIVMMLLALGLGVTGYMMSTGGESEAIEDIHEVLSNVFIVVVILHICGIALHTIRHGEAIGLSMVDGKKVDITDGDVITTTRTGIGILFVVMVAAFGFYLLRNYDSQKQTVLVFGKTLQLGENEGSEGGEQEGASESEEGEDHDD